MLGMDFLAHCNPEIDFAGGVMTFTSGLRVASVESSRVVLSSVQQLRKLMRSRDMADMFLAMLRSVSDAPMEEAPPNVVASGSGA